MLSWMYDPSLSDEAKAMLAAMAGWHEQFKDFTRMIQNNPGIHREMLRCQAIQQVTVAVGDNTFESIYLPAPSGHASRSTYLAQRQGWVKIGAAKDISGRIRGLQLGGVLHPKGMDITEPVILLAVFREDCERFLHECFAPQRIAGEWFLPDAHMKEWIDSTCAWMQAS